MRSSTGILLTGEYKWYKIVLRFVSFLFKSFWLFFPAILFIILGIWCFWTLGQGKDVIVAFAENTRARIYFFLAIALWTYVSWFSSRIVAYQKRFKQLEHIVKITGDTRSVDTLEEQHSFNYEIPMLWLEIFPRILGFACFLTVEMALLQLKFYGAPGLRGIWAWVLFGLLLLAYLVFNNKLSALAEKKRRFTRRLFTILLASFIVFAIITLMIKVQDLVVLLCAVVLLHLVYVVYTHLRRSDMKHREAEKAAMPQAVEKKPGLLRRWLYWLMDLLIVPRAESGYFAWFLLVALAGIGVYTMAVISLSLAVDIGPFPLVLLAFSVLLGFGNILAIISVRTKINWHLLVFIFALLFGSSETHYVRTTEQAKDRLGIYKQRQPLTEYFDNSIKDSARGKMIDSGNAPYDMYFVMANGGASRSGYWTAAVLGKLEDASRNKKGWFSKHLFCLSGASGGSIGNATFFALLDSTNKLQQKGMAGGSFMKGGTNFLDSDFLSYTLARMLGPDYFKYIFHFPWLDRAGALENSLEEMIHTGVDSADILPNMKNSFSSVLALKQQHCQLPILCINVTRMQDGNPGVVSNVKLNARDFNNRVDVLELVPNDEDISLSTAAILGARFPYVSPAGRIDQQLGKPDSIRPHYFVDGGYFDNSGAGVVQEMIRLINNYVRTSKDPVIRQRAARLRFVILHITNSPTGVAALEKVSPLANDLAAPVKTIIGAYEMQTSVNDRRLMNFLNDIDSIGPARAIYFPIHLYKKFDELKKDSVTGKRITEDPYPMNWFISDTMRRRMDRRLSEHPELNWMIRSISN